MLNILGSESKFEKYAEVAANAYLNDGVSLNDSIVKIAEEKELNPDQIKRVVEAANVKVFQKHFSDEDREGHKDVDFDVADPKVIIRRIYVVKKPEESMSDCGHVSSPLDFFKDLAMDNFSDRMQSDVDDLPVEKKKLDRPTLVIRIKTAKQNLEKKAYELNEEYCEKATEIAKRYRRSDADSQGFDNLCKEAYEHQGTELDPVLKSIAYFSKKEFNSLEGTPMVKVAGYPSKQYNELLELKELGRQYNRYKRASELAQEQLDDMDK
jgi:hypothetical protein